jgi:hypothetical protein
VKCRAPSFHNISVLNEFRRVDDRRWSRSSGAWTSSWEKYR